MTDFQTLFQNLMKMSLVFEHLKEMLNSHIWKILQWTKVWSDLFTYIMLILEYYFCCDIMDLNSEGSKQLSQAGWFCSWLFRRIQLHFTIMTIIANSLLAWGSTSSHLSAWTSVRGGVMQVDAHALCSPTPQEVRGTCFLGGWRIPVGGGRWGQDVAWHC